MTWSESILGFILVLRIPQMPKPSFRIVTRLKNRKNLMKHHRRKFSWAPVVFEVIFVWIPWHLSGGSDGKESACNTGDQGSVPVSGRSPGEGNGCPFQYSCLENSMDRGAWWATVHKVAKSQTRLKWLSTAQPGSEAPKQQQRQVS